MSAPDDVAAERFNICQGCQFNKPAGMPVSQSCWHQPSIGGFMGPQPLPRYWHADAPQCPAGKWPR